ILIFSWLPGQRLDQLFAGPAFLSQTVEAVGAALAELHVSREPFGHGPPTRTSASAERLRLPVLADWLGHLIPAASAHVHRLANSIVARLSESGACQCLLHGDFYAKQVVLRNGEVAFIDFDEAFAGEPVYDLGSFLAHLESDAVRGYVP